MDEGSHLTHLVIQNNINTSNLQYTTRSTCKTNSCFKQFIFNCSDTSGRNHHFADLIGSNSEANLKGVFFAKNDQIIDNKTEINHLDHDCKSNQTYKGILTDKSKASYLSSTYVDKIAQKTNGYQLSKGILLSEDASFFSKPELKIYADDVKCSHGSAVGQLDEEELFYLRSRGIPYTQAKSILVESFLSEFIDEFNLGELADTFHQRITDWIRAD